MDTTQYKTETRTDGNGQPYTVRLPIASSGVISSANLSPVTPTVIPTPPQDTTNYGGITNGIINSLGSLTEQTNNAQKNVDKSQNSILETMNTLLGKEGDTQAANESSGLNDATKQLNMLNAQAKSLNREAQAIPIQTQERNKNTGATDAGVAPQTAGALRENALKALSIGQQADIATANYTAAKDKAEQIIDLKYKPLEQMLEIKKQQYEFNKDALSAIDKKRTDALGVAIKKEQDDLAAKKDQESKIQDVALEAGKNGAPASVIAQITSSKDVGEAIKNGTGWYQDPLDVAYKKAQIAKINNDIATSGASGVDAAQVLAYAQQYASNGQIPTGLPKGSFGLVAQAAKDLPKPAGTLVDMNTGIKSSKLVAGQDDGIVALADLTKKLEELKGLPRVGGPGTVVAYNGLRNEIVDLIARARTGAAISANEERLYKAKVPGIASFVAGAKIDSLENSLKGKLDTTLATNGLSIYGYSKVKLGDTDYTVGQIIQNDQGQSARVNPDGSLTPLN